MITDILVYELKNSHSDKFYTIIHLGMTFDANYGPNSGATWCKSKSYPISEWSNVINKRGAHEYVCVRRSEIILEHYLKCKDKLTKLDIKDDRVKILWKSLLKDGNLTTKEMEQANNLYQS